MAGVKVRKGDTVQVISGKDKGMTGRVLIVDPDTQRVIVEGVNRVVKHTKVGQGDRGAKTGGLIHTEAPIHISNVMVVDDEGKATKVGSRRDSVEKRRADGTTYEGTRRVRVARRTGKDIE
ncbi:MAG: 50S ribosomal protein L24 [Actinobacteria bacterium]|jgi:large subunit ribosomal protein L24|nr:50S ribosomal protein L24 [Actinomycetota bacterium]MCO5300054.1 50S ribosomal protein L24 [Candidatus Nanopelagicales bacterium]HPE12074.1 50S ribosomal protein L24 [Actinomycetota bacterium]HPQ83106.1 50S ribosomal protein L24 [Actinomycetota bacterium]HRV65765.1 50S ribosomal protein L24 [Candidatus Nanopelagicales bacterium]